MTGKNQHYVPRVFLRGFLIEGAGEKVWKFRQGLDKPVINSIGDVSSSEYFYSAATQDGVETLDSRLADYEAEHLTKSLGVIRALSEGTITNPQVVCDVAAHLVRRSSFFRDMGRHIFTEMSEKVNVLSEVLSEGVENMDHIIPPRFFELLVEQELLENVRGDLDISPETVAKIAYFFLRENSGNWNVLYRDTLKNGSDFFSKNSKKLPSYAHKKILDYDFKGEKLGLYFRKMTWKVCDFLEEHIILPDCICIARSLEGDWLPLEMLGTEEISCIAFPVSSTRIIFGFFDSPPIMSVANFNELAARCCAHEFLASKQTGDLSKCVDLIGTKMSANTKAIVEVSGDQLNILSKLPLDNTKDGDCYDTDYDALIGTFSESLYMTFIQCREVSDNDFDDLSELERTLISFLKSSYCKGVEARRSYRVQGDHWLLFVTIYNIVSEVLAAITQFLCNRRKIQPVADLGANLREYLVSSGLELWWALFDKDLFANFSESTDAGSLSSRIFVNSHIERLFLSFGVLIESPMGDEGGTVKMCVPLSTDYKYLANLENDDGEF